MSVNTLLKIVETANKAVRMVEAGIDCYEVCQSGNLSTAQGVVRATADVGLIAFQAASFGANLRGASPNWRVGLEAGAAIFDVGQRVVVLTSRNDVKLGDWLDLGCSCIFRAAAVTRTTLTLKPEFFGNRDEQIKKISDVLESGATLVQNREQANKIYSFGKRQLVYLIDYCRGQGNLALEVPIEEGIGDEPIIPQLKVDPQMAAAIMEIQGAEIIQQLQKIPCLFSQDLELKKYSCSLSGKPIRHVLVLLGTENSAHPIMYEKDQIIQRLTNGSIPQNWPQQIPFKRENLVTSLAIQQKINQRLQLLFDDFKSVSLGPPNAFRTKVINLAAQIGIAGNVKSEEIVDHLLSKVPSTIGISVSAQKVSYIFHGEQKKAAIKIVAQTKQALFKPESSSLVEQKRALCAFLGSNAPEDKAAMRKAFQEFNKLELYISADLQKFKGKFFT